jgi:hypothetical protein
MEMQMAAKKTAKKITKTAFILSLPRDLPAAQAVEKAKAAGIKGLSETYIYKIRSRKKTAGGAEKGKTSATGKTRSAKAAPKKKKGTRGSASDFVRSMPATMSAKDVVAAGTKKGLKISEGLTYSVRAYDRAKGKKGSSKKRPGPKPKDFKFQVFSGGGGGSEADLKKAALAVGFPRALKVVEDLGKKFEGLQRQYAELMG